MWAELVVHLALFYEEDDRGGDDGDGGSNGHGPDPASQDFVVPGPTELHGKPPPRHILAALPTLK